MCRLARMVIFASRGFAFASTRMAVTHGLSALVRLPELISGDDSTRAPPLPIPNREVKPCHADGTAKAGEQVIAVLLKKPAAKAGFFVLDRV